MDCETTTEVVSPAVVVGQPDEDDTASANAKNDENNNTNHSKMEVRDDTEDQLGISVYLSPEHAGFSAVLKARYSDFVVHEVGQDGKVARLESLSTSTTSNAATATSDGHDQDSTVKQSDRNDDAEDKASGGGEASRKRKRKDEGQKEEGESETAAAAVGESTSSLPSEPSWTDLQTELGKMIVKEAAEKIIQFFQKDFEERKVKPAAATERQEKESPAARKENDEEELFFVALPPIKDKDTRRKVHEWIRCSALHPFATADTADDKDGNKVIRLWLSRYESKMPNYGKFDRSGKRIAPSAQRRGPKPKRPEGYLKFVLYKENCDTHTAIKQVTHRLGRGGGRGGRGRGGRHNQRGNDKVRVGYAGMKDKRGVTAQFCTLHQRSPHEIEWVNNQRPNPNVSNHRHGGGNSSTGGAAVVRVGNFEYVTEELRLGSLKGNRFDVVLRNVRTDDSHDNETTKEVVAKSAEALRKHGFINYFGVQRFGKFHDTHLAGIAFLQGDFEKLIELIMRPKEGEAPKVLEARTNWQQRFSKLKQGAPKDERARAEASCAKSVVRSFGRFMASEVSVLESLLRNPLDYKRAFSCINKTMRMMFLHAVQSLLWNKVASFRIQTLGRAIVEGDLVYKKDDAGAVKLVTQEDIGSNKYMLADVVLPLLGTTSQRPGNESGKLFDRLLDEIGVTVDMFKKIQDRDVSCRGDYRKLICRPTDVDFSVVEYRDPVQPLLQTDLMKLNGVKVLDGVDDKDSKVEEGTKIETPLLGMVVGFTLPSSAYATIALRELMKKPTSSEYQKELGLGESATTS